MSQTIPAVGSQLADIALTNADGAQSSLDELRANDRAVVFFLRASTCAICLGHAKAITTMAAAGELGGARVILVTPGDAQDAATASARLQTAVWASGSGHAEVGLGKFLAIQHSGIFLLDANGSVEYSKTSTLPMGSFSKPELAAAIAG